MTLVNNGTVHFGKVEGKNIEIACGCLPSIIDAVVFVARFVTCDWCQREVTADATKVGVLLHPVTPAVAGRRP